MKKNKKNILAASLIFVLLGTNAVTIYNNLKPSRLTININESSNLDQIEFQFKKDIILKIYDIADERKLESSYKIEKNTIVTLNRILSEGIPNTELEITIDDKLYTYAIQYNGKEGGYQILSTIDNKKIQENEYYKIKTK